MTKEQQIIDRRKELIQKLKTFICDDCKMELPIDQRCDSNYDICKDCLDNYEDKTGYCSVHCRITGVCDESC